MALLQTLQQTRDAALAAATLNGQTALVQGVSALPEPARREYLRTAVCLLSTATLAVAAVMLAAPGRVAGWCGLPEGSSKLVSWLALPLVLSSVFVFLNALLNVLGEIGPMAMLQVLAAAVTAAAAWPVAAAVRRGHPEALAQMQAFPAGISLIATAAVLAGRRGTVRGWVRRSPSERIRWWAPSAARHFLSISGAMLAGGLLSSAVLLAIRSGISRAQGLAHTGQFDAAWGISTNHVTLVLASLRPYFLPTLARARTREERSRHMSTVLTVATLGAAPIIVTIAVLKPLVLATFYSRAFYPAAAYLRWTLLADYLKVSFGPCSRCPCWRAPTCAPSWPPTLSPWRCFSARPGGSRRCGRRPRARRWVSYCATPRICPCATATRAATGFTWAGRARPSGLPAWSWWSAPRRIPGRTPPWPGEKHWRGSRRRRWSAESRRRGCCGGSHVSHGRDRHV